MKRIALALVMIMVLLLVGSTAVAEAPAVKLGILAPQTTHGWVAAVAYNAEVRAKELLDAGAIAEYKLFTSANETEMTSQLDDLKLWGANAIVAFPQWTGMEVPIQAAIDEGIYVVNFDIEINADGVYRLSGNNEDMGVQGAHYIAEKLGGEGKVVIMNVPSSGSVSELRGKGFTDTLAAEYPGIEIIGTYATAFTREDGLKDMADILVANAQIDAVYSMDDETSIGALQAIKEAGRTDIKAITGGGGCQEYFNLMLSEEYQDIWVQSALYSPAMVKDAINMAMDIVGGAEVEPVKILGTTIVDRSNAADFLDANTPY